ncbi:MAG: hypothetical protein MUF31_04680 [Akkermansiaceae bacterium]|jgi:hypothetical protein|nr:hypothetical protein [Akkermansiaceae bacterium]
MSARFLPATLLCALLVSCAPDPWAIPGPSKSVTRADAIRTAYLYSKVPWMPEERHRLHGDDGRGVLVHTPDITLSRHGYSNGWWQPGVPAIGMAYQWGGFDTPRSFLKSLDRGELAGDISTSEKRRLDDAGTSTRACGIDCSGFVSRCWRLSTPHSTRKLPSICDRLDSWSELRPGDILLNDRHVVLFKAWDTCGKQVLVYESGPFPVWRVNAASIPVKKLLAEGYQPWRYRGIGEED